jgi:DNA end-binding protein Ku
MPRSNWKGHISFGLVNIPIVLYTSEDLSERVKFHQLDKRNNARIKYKRVNVETGKEVPWEDIIKGYEYEKDTVFVVGEGELEKIAGDNVRTIAIESFTDAKNISYIDVQKSYYLVPDKHGEKGYVILREALSNSNKIGIAKVIISTKEYLCAVAVYKNALVLYLLHYSNEIRPLSEFNIPSDELTKYKITKKEIDISKQLIQSMTKPWKPQQYQDEYQKAVHKWAEEEATKKPHTKMKPRSKVQTGKKVNFVDLLKKSLATSKSTKSSKKGFVNAKTKPAHKHATRH